MTVDFKDLKVLEEQDFSLTLSEVLEARALQYKDVILEEILNLLEEASEVYRSLEPTLPAHLRDTARKEIEFFLWLYQESMSETRN
jgi:hypothetical protein